MSTKPREIIQLSLGPNANAVTAHLLNLQGLAATEDEALCDPLTTHYIENSTYVPRALLVDAGTSTVTTDDSSSFLQDTSNIPWHGDVQVLGYKNHHDTNPFLATASTLAYSPYSRYHAEKGSGAQYNRIASNDRHVVWDSDEEEEDEEDVALKLAQQRKAKSEWTTQTAPTLGKELETQFRPPTHWTDMLMPPFAAKSSKITLPYSHQSQLVPHWDVRGGELPFLQDWKEDVLLEQLRHLLEPCDYGVQGAVITTEGCGLYASLTKCLLEELQEECKSATRWVNHIDVSKDDTSSASESNWQEFQVARVRQNISSGLALYDFTEQAHAILPLVIDSNNLFRSSAQLAMALEASGLPYRLSSSGDRYKMGLQNAPFLGQGGSDTAWGSTASRLSMTEYLTMLQPSSRYSMLEMDVLNQNDFDNQDLYDAIKQGTSVEQDQRMRQRGEGGLRGRPRDVAPGAWLQDSTSDRGLLSSLSYSAKESKALNLNRSVHHHFALSTAVRPQLAAGDTTMRDYLTCSVQGMGIRYRPERSMATIVDQTLGSLTFGDGANYGAGVYWKHLLPSVDMPVVAVLGNTTRAFSRLDRIATDMKSTIRSSRFHGYVSRDVMNGVLPEMDDCEEALEGCWDKRDLYHPPEGSGLEDDDGSEF